MRSMMRMTAVLSLVALVACSGSQSPLTGWPVKSPEGTIYLVPLDGFSDEATWQLVHYYHDQHGLDIQVLPSIPVDSSLLNPRRRQLMAEKLTARVHDAYSDRVRDSKDVLIGLTAQDMYLQSSSWQFAFGWRSPDLRTAVVSSARMDLHYSGEPAEVASPSIRLRKMVTKDIGTLYYHLPLSLNPRSALYWNIMGIQELDGMGEQF